MNAGERVKKRKIAVILLAVFLVIAGVIYSLNYVYQVNSSMPVMGNVMPKRQVVIDPGHGGEDGGAESNSLIEKEINLDISLILEKMLKVSGFDVIMTRTEDVSIYDTDAKGTRSKKRSDILNRLAIANENPDAILISVHQNKFSQSKYWGAQMFYGKENEFSKELAQQLQTSFVQLLQQGNKREIKPITSDVYLIKHAKIPAVLTECGFLSNPQEAKKLASDEYKKQVDFAIYNGILQFYKT